jgi:hypothetical protein
MVHVPQGVARCRCNFRKFQAIEEDQFEHRTLLLIQLGKNLFDETPGSGSSKAQPALPWRPF